MEAGFVESNSVKMPVSVKIALLLWAIVGALLLGMTYGVAFEDPFMRNWGAILFWLFWSAVVVLNMWGLLHRATAGWWWNKQCINLFAGLRSFPFALAVLYIAYRLMVGTVDDQLSYVSSMLAFIGLIMLLPAVLFWGLFFTIRTGVLCRLSPLYKKNQVTTRFVV